MPVSKKSSNPLPYEFQVTCVVGTVYVDYAANGRTPHAAALTLIGDCGMDGDFRFPNENGGETRVSVEFAPSETVEDATLEPIDAWS